MNLRPAHDVPAADEKSAAIVAAAKVFLDSLDADQRHAATYRFTDNAQRSNWSNFPEGMVPRGGVKLGALSASQRENLDGLLGELLSEDGVRNITWQLAAEDLLVSGNVFGVMKYGSEHYYAAFLGEPSTTEPWMFQFGGHHLAINATVFGPNVSFWGLYRLLDNLRRQPSIRFAGRRGRWMRTPLAVQLRQSPTPDVAGRVQVRMIRVAAGHALKTRLAAA